MSMIFILIQSKFDIDINNDDLLENIWEHKKRGKKELKQFEQILLFVLNPFLKNCVVKHNSQAMFHDNQGMFNWSKS